MGCFFFFAFIVLLLTLMLNLTGIICMMGCTQPPNAVAPGGGNAPGPGSVTYRGGPGTANQVPLISARDFTGGNAPLTLTGDFSFDATVGLYTPETFADGVETRLSYGDFNGAGGLQLAFSQEDGSEGLGLNVFVAPWRANYMGQGCSWEVEVTDQRVSGHISCADIPAVNEDNGANGTVDLELDFTADSAPATDAN